MWSMVVKIQRHWLLVRKKNEPGLLKVDVHRPTAVLFSLRTVVRWWVKKVKFSHTRYRALGPELIPVHRQSARR